MKISNEELRLIIFSINTKMSVLEDQIDNLYKLGGKSNLDQRKILVRKFSKLSQLGNKLGKKLGSNLWGAIKLMNNQPTRMGSTELYTARVLNMSVAQYYGLVKEYNEIVVETRKLNKKVLEKNGDKAELNLYYSIRYSLNKLVLEKLKGEK